MMLLLPCVTGRYCTGKNHFKTSCSARDRIRIRTGWPWGPTQPANRLLLSKGPGKRADACIALAAAAAKAGTGVRSRPNPDSNRNGSSRTQTFFHHQTCKRNEKHINRRRTLTRSHSFTHRESESLRTKQRIHESHHHDIDQLELVAATAFSLPAPAAELHDGACPYLMLITHALTT